MKKFFKYFNIVLLVFLLFGIIFAFTNSRQILDYLALRNYDPPAKIEALASATTMNDKTRNVFYVNKPQLQNKQDFKNSCSEKEQTIVLGCYINTEGIFLLEVDDPRLNGIIEVTAVHEVLHALYDRLSTDERNEVDKMTQAFFSTLDNERIKTNVENYRKKDPSIVPNELHSILASEVRNLSPELEAYYAKYFSNRNVIVDFSERYEKTFTDIENQVKSYDEQLKNLKLELDSFQKELTDLDARIDSERQRLDNLLQSNRIDEYNASVEGFNSLVNEFNRLASQRKALADEYNRIVDEYNRLALIEAELVQELKTDDVKQIEVTE